MFYKNCLYKRRLGHQSFESRQATPMIAKGWRLERKDDMLRCNSKDLLSSNDLGVQGTFLVIGVLAYRSRVCGTVRYEET
ncbi:hypothetical protein V1478_000364 [Vespula squamosa]|uniref:Uncharacterized protein n=1 Tax=Vespula squamosa TaxID=30214 RepID=A0ABD2C7C6_VESSQ